MFYDEDTDLEELAKDGDSQEAIILLVGGSSRDADGLLVDTGASESRARVADALAEGRGASHIRKTEGGLRTFSKVSFEDDPRGEPAVIDATPLVVEKNLNFVQSARAWVSLNSLRRLSGKLIFVICVVTSSGANDPVHKEPDFSRKEFTWLHLLAYIFQGHLHAMMLLVKIEGTDRSDLTKSGIRDALQQGGFARSNVSFETLEVETLRTTVLPVVLGHSLFHDTSRNNWNTMVPFRLNVATSTAEKVDAYGPWGPDRVILFGPNGSGKTTLAKMLTLGRLDSDYQNLPVGSRFSVAGSVAGSGKRSIVRESRRGEGRGWYVVDTPDLVEMVGELSLRMEFYNDVTNSIIARAGSSVAGIEETLYKTVGQLGRLLRVGTGGAAKPTPDEWFREFARQAEGIHTHVIYLQMKGRLDVTDLMLWRIFLQSYERCNLNSSLSIVISAADQAWIEENISDLRTLFKGCQNFVSADFPSDSVYVEGNDFEEMLEVYQWCQLNSLKDLEDRLAVLSTRLAWSGSESFPKDESKRRKVNDILLKAAMNSLKSSNGLDAGAGGQIIGNSSRRSSSWRPSHRYI